MMKRYLPLFLALVLLLTGCGPAASENDGGATIPAQTIEPAEPGIYEPGSAVEQATEGAVRSYVPPMNDCHAMMTAGEEMILFSGAEQTTLTVLEGENLTQRLQKTLKVHLEPEQVSLNPEKKELAYYDSARRAVVMLDFHFKEARQIPLPEEAVSEGLLSPDWKTVYYAAADGIYGLDLGTGLPRLIKQQKNDAAVALQLCFAGEVLACTSRLENGQVETQYIQTRDGSTIYRSKPLESFSTNRDVYFFPKQEGSVLRYGCGLWLEEPRQLTLPLDARAIPVMDLSGALLLEQEEQQLTVEFADLLTMNKTAALTLDADVQILGADGFDSDLWLLVREETGAVRLWRWDMEQSKLPQPESCTAPFETWAQLDMQALHGAKDKATALGNRFGVRVMVATEVLTMVPEGCEVEPEYLSQAYQRDMKALERALSAYPKGFFEQASEAAGSLTVSLVRSILQKDSPTENRETGMVYWNGDTACLVLTMGEELEQSFYHAMSHLIDTRVLGRSLAYDDWEKLNPAGFAYDYNYLTNQERTDDAYLEGEDRAFIDTFSMSFPREDRARIMEYAMLPGKEELFTSDVMQMKLWTICTGIREAFELSDTACLWEQYLTIPLETEED